MKPNPTDITIKTDDIKALDQISAQAIASIGAPGSSFEQTFAVADAMVKLREAITPAMMERFMALQNIKLGFMTDKNPKVWNKRLNNGAGGYNEPYPAQVVKDCVIEATLRGVKTIGNHFNIIASGCYITLEGYQHKLKTLEGLTDLKVNVGVPKVAGGGALVELSASWSYKGKPDSLQATIAAKGDDYAGADSYVGKASRKFLKRVYERLTGTTDPDGDADDAPAQLPEGPKAPAKFEPSSSPCAATAKSPPIPAEPESPQPDQPKTAPVSLEVVTPQSELVALLTDHLAADFEKFRACPHIAKLLPNADSYGEWNELPSEFCVAFAKSALVNKTIHWIKTQP